MKRLDEYLKSYELLRVKSPELQKKLILSSATQFMTAVQKLDEIVTRIEKEMEADEEDATG